MRTLIAIIIALGSLLYLLPTAIAVGRTHKDTAMLFILNLAFGWTLIGWVFSLAYAFKN